MSEDKKNKQKMLTVKDLADRMKPIYEELKNLMCEGVEEEAERRFKDDFVAKAVWKKEEIDRRTTFSALMMARVALAFPNKMLLSRFLSLPLEAQATISHLTQLIRHEILTTLRFIADRHLDLGIELKDGDIENLLYLITHAVSAEATFLAVEAREAVVDNILKVLAVRKQLEEKMKKDGKSRFNYLA